MTIQKLVRIRKVLFALSITALVGGVIFLLPRTRANFDPATRDATRISDLQQVQKYLQTYFNRCGYYPGNVPPAPPAPCPAWASPHGWPTMSIALTGFGNGLGVNSVPNDPLATRTYLYAAPDGKSFVLGAMLEDSANPNLLQSVHGVVNDVDCEGSMYCLTNQ